MDLNHSSYQVNIDVISNSKENNNITRLYERLICVYTEKHITIQRL